MKHCAAGKVAAGPYQRNAVGQRQLFALPKLNRGVVAPYPLAIGVVKQNWNAAKRVTPFAHRRIKMRMRDDNAIKTAQRFNGVDGFVGNERDAFPEDVAGVRGQ